MATLSRFFAWRGALINVQPDTLIRWQRRGFRLFWRWKSRPVSRPPLPKDLRALMRRMAAENPIWGEEHIANELQLQLGVLVSPADRIRSGDVSCAIMPRRWWPATSSPW